MNNKLNYHAHTHTQTGVHAIDKFHQRVFLVLFKYFIGRAGFIPEAYSWKIKKMHRTQRLRENEMFERADLEDCEQGTGKRYRNVEETWNHFHWRTYYAPRWLAITFAINFFRTDSFTIRAKKIHPSRIFRPSFPAYQCGKTFDISQYYLPRIVFACTNKIYFDTHFPSVFAPPSPRIYENRLRSSSLLDTNFPNEISIQSKSRTIFLLFRFAAVCRDNVTTIYSLPQQQRVVITITGVRQWIAAAVFTAVRVPFFRYTL